MLCYNVKEIWEPERFLNIRENRSYEKTSYLPEGV